MPWMTENLHRYITSIKPPPHTPRRSGSERRPEGWSRHPWPVGTTPSRRSSPPAFPSLSSPIHSVRTCEKKKKTFNTKKFKKPRACKAKVSHGLHVGSGEFKGPFHRQRIERRHPLALDLQVQPGTREEEGKTVSGPINKAGVRVAEPFAGKQSGAYPFRSYFLKAGKAASGSSSCEEKGQS